MCKSARRRRNQIARASASVCPLACTGAYSDDAVELGALGNVTGVGSDPSDGRARIGSNLVRCVHQTIAGHGPGSGALSALGLKRCEDVEEVCECGCEEKCCGCEALSAAATRYSSSRPQPDILTPISQIFGLAPAGRSVQVTHRLVQQTCFASARLASATLLARAFLGRRGCKRTCGADAVAQRAAPVEVNERTCCPPNGRTTRSGATSAPSASRRLATDARRGKIGFKMTG
jgi:hypothetical protein